jgi:hypothetical protein
MKTLQEGMGDRLDGMKRLRLKYVIEDDHGNILFAHNDTWIHLSEAIPGFIHGLQGMRIGEKRTLYIHPALGYGALTTLPPCALLVAYIQLLDADPVAKVPLPPVTPLEFDWLLDQKLVTTIQDSIDLLPGYAGAFYRGLLNQAASEYPSLNLLKLLSPFDDEKAACQDNYTAGRSFFAFSSRVKAPAIELAGEGIVLNSIQSPPPPARSRGFDAEENAKNDRPAV